MPQSRDDHDEATQLRAAAENMRHDLGVYQVELEIQNEELRKARRDHEVALADYTELFDFLPIGYAAMTQDETIREINHAGARLLGRTRQKLIGTQFFDYLLVEHRSTLSKAIGSALSSHDPATCELAVRRPTGDTVPVRATCAGSVRAEPLILLAFEDISAQKAAERALIEADRRKDEFIATLSHELRNPLAPIRTGVYVLGHAKAGGKLEDKTLAIIERQVAHMTRLIDDLLDVTRIVRGKIELQRAPTDLGKLVRRVAEDHAASFISDSLRFDSDLTDEPVWVDADAARIVQVTTNLLNNAQKFTPAGGSVTIALALEAGDAVLRVRDTGGGGSRATSSNVCSSRSHRRRSRSSARVVASAWGSRWPKASSTSTAARSRSQATGQGAARR